jgi:hypothetical protein
MQVHRIQVFYYYILYFIFINVNYYTIEKRDYLYFVKWQDNDEQAMSVPEVCRGITLYQNNKKKLKKMVNGVK